MFYVICRVITKRRLFRSNKYIFQYLKINEKFKPSWVTDIDQATHYEEKEWAARMTSSVFESVIAVRY